ncbi:MAG: SdiA-regulated domain-containing protein, partial [Draconibacterium sp.]|nr:SdiA-regulated domain-containing protein [Draconibacterium sp.]
SKSDKKRIQDFSPSGIAIHPENGSTYILSAKGSTLVIFDHNSDLEKVVLLNDKKIPQPEGICFDSKSNLYIATEGKGSPGKIFIFTPNH